MSGFKISFIGLITLFSFLLTSQVFSQATFYTNGNFNDDWDDPDSWKIISGIDDDSDNIPDANDDVIIGSGSYITVSNDDHTFYPRRNAFYALRFQSSVLILLELMGYSWLQSQKFTAEIWLQYVDYKKIYCFLFS